MEALLLALFDNPAVLQFLAMVLLAILGFLARKVLSLIDVKWANEMLAGVGAHVDLAVRAATRTYIQRIDLADDDGIVTDAERAEAREAALDAAMAEIGLNKVAKALGLSRGQKATTDAAREFLARGIDARLADLGLAPKAEKSDTDPLAKPEKE